MYQYFEREGYQADIPILREEYPALKTFDQWLHEGGMSRLAHGGVTSGLSSGGGRPAGAVMAGGTKRLGRFGPRCLAARGAAAPSDNLPAAPLFSLSQRTPKGGR